MKITAIRDYAALQKLAQSLWGSSNEVHGAAIMVGAGFSRAAARCGDEERRMPLWANLRNALAKELDIETDEVADPLRLAEQYVAFFGRRALIQLVQAEICDLAWSPGNLYKLLLQLPWKEVLTTNWDTLLERSAESLFEPKYAIVNQQSDLAVARPPRITKLHGTIGVTPDFIFTQEDYRQYTQRYATFVNFARQVFIENELCLIGFSGDDPNFLKWAGWVRDRLDDHARRIFLVGNLNLPESSRKYLESINIAPIDLYEMVCNIPDTDAQHISAIAEFLEELLSLKPKSANDWSPSNYPSIASSRAKQRGSMATTPSNPSVFETASEIVQLLEQDRKAFPQWILCPRRQSLQLTEQLVTASHALRLVERNDSSLEALLVFEIVWRIGRTYQVIPTDMANKVLSIFGSTEPSGVSSRQRSEVLLTTLRCLYPVCTEQARDTVERVAKALDSLCEMYPDIRDERHFMLAVFARDQLDFKVMARHADAIGNSFPMAIQKKAALLAELGQFTKAESLFAEAYTRLKADFSGDRGSLYLRDRLAWARLLAKGISQWTSSGVTLDDISFSEDKECDPWQYFNFLRDRIQTASEQEAKRYRIEPTFTPGSYRKGVDSKGFSNEPEPIRILYGICNLGGVPIRWNRISFLGNDAARICALSDIPWQERLSLALKVADLPSSSTLARTLSRVEIACLDDKDIQWALSALQNSVEFWIKEATKRSGGEKIFVFQRLGCMMEALGRLTVRAESGLAESLFERALNIGENPNVQSFGLASPLRTLLENTWQSILPKRRESLLPEILDFPLAAEVSDDLAFRQEWPDLSFPVSGERPENTALDRRVSQLIEFVGKSEAYTRCSLVRLYPMARARMLTMEEVRNLKQNLFDGSVPGELPTTGILSSALLTFFRDESSGLTDVIKKRLFSAPLESKLTIEYLEDILWASDDSLIRLMPTGEESCQLFELLSSWDPKETETDVLGFRANEDRKIARLIGEVLSRVVVPQLSEVMLTSDNLNRVAGLHSKHKDIVTTEGLVYFAVHDKNLTGPVKRLIISELHQEEPRRTISAAHAIMNWRKAERSQITESLCSRLIHVAASSQTSALHGILGSLTELYSRGLLNERQKQSLMEILPIIFDASDYRHRRFFQSGLDATSVSLTRRECARIASAILDDGNSTNADLDRIVALAAEDPLPEVRFACEHVSNEAVSGFSDA